MLNKNRRGLGWIYFIEIELFHLSRHNHPVLTVSGPYKNLSNKKACHDNTKSFCKKMDATNVFR